MTDDLNDGPRDPFVSKTQRKKQMDELQGLGRALLDLSNEQLKKIPLSETLAEAIQAYKRLSAHGAKKRQEQYIGRLMRDIDPEPIRAYLAASKGESAAHTGWLHQIERWRERLLTEEQALSSFIDAFPETNIQLLRTLIRNAHKEQQTARPPKSFRLLFQAIKEIIPEPRPGNAQNGEKT